MPNFGYHFARAEASAIRSLYRAALPQIIRRRSNVPAALPFEVYSYSGEMALPEQVASIRSLLRHAGRPRKFTVVSDGSYTTRSLEVLRALDDSVTVAPANEWQPRDVPEGIRSYLAAHPTGRQLALIMSLPAAGPALYLDSDVLFFPGASILRSLATAASALYLADCQVSADERLFRTATERENPVNTGVLFLTEKLDWSLGIGRFLELDGAPNFFTNQTITHLVMHANKAQPFDRRQFVLQLDDQFSYADRSAGPEIVLRHYVNPVRHKFWTALRR
ncbi:MAG: hypothetical protein H0V56_05680 [Chthoniobacterales bacterium]|nr:hypothetical protein [Chthoniobacterales bacterium]